MAHTTWRKCVRDARLLAIGMGLVLAGPTLAQSDAVNVKGSATKNKKTCSGDMLFDTGASVSIINRGWAQAIGLLDANGNPPAGTPKVGANPKPNTNPVQYTYELWCFTDVDIEAEDSKKRKCKSSETVYVSTSNDALGPMNILGVPWQTDVDACYRAVGQQVLWPWEEPKPGDPKKPAVPKEDSKTKEIKIVIPDVILQSSSGPAQLDMVPYMGLGYTVIPQSVAAALGAPIVGTIDLQAEDPIAWLRLAVGAQNGTEQTIFPVAQLFGTFVGIGPPGPPIQVLVSNDLNSDFGIMGDNMLTHAIGPETYVWASTNSTLYFNDPCASGATGLATGSIINFPTGSLCPTAAGNQDLSEVPADSTIAGYNASPAFGVAEDFSLDCPNNIVDEIAFHLYATNCPASGPILTSCVLEIQSDLAGVPSGTVVAGPFNAFAEASPGVYRTFNAQATNCARVVRTVTMPTPGVTLPAGTYWAVIRATASTCGSGPWMPMNTNTGDNLVTPGGNAKVFTGGSWQPMLTGNGVGNPCGAAVFVHGSPPAGCYADCDGNGSLNIFDYICFGNAFTAGQPYADCDGNGSFNIFDYICFGNAYSAGCP